MEFLAAFLLGGTLCVMFQFIAAITKLDVPELLIIGLMIGGLCGTFGFSAAMTAFGGAGYGIMVIGAGEALAATTQAALAGVPMPLITILGVVAVLTLIGIVTGALSRSMRGKKASAAEPEVSSEQA